MLRVTRKPKLQPQGGYTIIESLIFLAVSGAMVVAVMVLIGGQQGKAQFQQSIRELEVKFQDIANDVSTGNPRVIANGTTYCSISSTSPFDATISTAVPPANPTERCIFVGKALEFASETYTEYALVGRQRIDVGGKTKETESLRDSKAVVPGGLYTPTTREFGAGITIESITFDNGTGPELASSIGFYTTFQGYDTDDQLSSGSINAVVGVVPSSEVGTSAPDKIRTAIDNDRLVRNPKKGITICFKSGTSNQKAKMVIGGTGGAGSITTVIGGSC